MTEPISLRVRYPEGSQTIFSLYGHSRVSELKREISKISNIPVPRLSLKYGYPPKRLDLPDYVVLERIGLQSGETIIAEEEQDNDQIENVFENRVIKLSNENHSEILNQIPNKDGLIMIRRQIPADNSCLFNSIAYTLENKSKTKTKELRKIVAAYVMSDPDRYNEVVLEKSNEKYCEWIQKDSSWGGAVELEILSKYYNTEICAIDVENLVAIFFGGNQNYKKRIYLSYDGIHYDVIVRNISEDMDESMDITTFDPNDRCAYDGALTIAKELHAKKQFTNLSKLGLECGACHKKFTGEKEALSHNHETGHSNFQEVSL